MCRRAMWFGDPTSMRAFLVDTPSATVATVISCPEASSRNRVTSLPPTHTPEADSSSISLPSEGHFEVWLFPVSNAYYVTNLEPGAESGSTLHFGGSLSPRGFGSRKRLGFAGS